MNRYIFEYECEKLKVFNLTILMWEKALFPTLFWLGFRFETQNPYSLTHKIWVSNPKHNFF
jgi:hypothetical protein